MNLIIAGDLAPTESNMHLFNSADITTLFGEELLEVWNSADYRILNLEVPLSNKEEPIPKYGPNLIAPTETFNGIKALKPSLVTLANNHILDQGIQGLNTTVNLFNETGIPFVGVGDNLNEATKPFILQHQGIKIGVYACAENEFSIATSKTAGVNPFDPLLSLDHIASLKEKCDYVIVLHHGGKEHYRYPSPYLKKVCRRMTEKGADFVVCQHSHCIGSYEDFKGSTIVYGQGNFLFDYSKKNEFWETSLLIKLNFTNVLTVDYIPLVKKDNGVRLAVDKGEHILKEFQLRSKEILEEGFIEEKYQEFAKESFQSYIRKLSGFNKWLTRIDRRLLNGMLLRNKYSRKKLLAIENTIESEAHRELILKGLHLENKE
ncbi:CapA family protein [Salipaludibacillus daqingensis]|uniref:CapA family protein n=1 Tax=Salipaludibacillus daqingensis TaxID=3041001 RepID=UPI002474B54F|nr:CapA family protein [Salipaludibacillus daqingensis]